MRKPITKENVIFHKKRAIKKLDRKSTRLNSVT